MLAKAKGRAWPHVAFGLYLALAAFCLVGPGYAWWGNRIEPYVLGLPLSFAWMAMWAVATFLVLGAYHLIAGGLIAGGKR